jgi:MutS domain V
VSPQEEYGRRLQAHEQEAQRLERAHVRLGYVRLVLVAAALALAWVWWRSGAVSAWWITAPVVVFVAVAVYHERALRRKQCVQRAAEFYRTGLARIEDRWSGIGEKGERFADPHHVYSADLDLFGPDSLFQLLSSARTRMGEETLAEWLLAPAATSEIAARQGAARELAEKIDFREELAVVGEDAKIGVHPDALIKWAESPFLLPNALRWIAPVLTLASVATAVRWFSGHSARLFVLVLLINAALMFALRRNLERALEGADQAFEDIGLVEAVMERLEREKFDSTRLREVMARLSSEREPSSRVMKRFGRIVELVRSRNSLLLRTLDWPLLYSVNMAYVAEAWRHNYGTAVRTWLDAIGEFEALVSLGAYAYEHPRDVFPEFITGTAKIEARRLGHPLIAEAACIRNDVNLGGDARVLLVSGSNMSGKSTLLRTVGINVVLAMAGAPVRAEQMRLTGLQVGASIRINDSLHEASSRFYAEVKRLRAILELAGREVPLVFLLDELLQGTNSHDRRVGAEGALRELVERGAIGLVSTHDLALTEVSGGNGWIRNVHFQDEFVGDKMQFDYKLRDGVVTKSNGLELMRALGIKV